MPAARAAPPRQHVLVVDDNADMRDYIARLLGPLGSVETASDGASALAAARRRPPDLLIADVMMPNLDGFELVAALRSDPGIAHIPVLILSARAGEEAKVEGLSAGADDYMVKPFSTRDLLARVHALLRTSELRAHERAQAEAARQERARKDEFLAMLAHELRNPLAPIMNAASLLQNAPEIRGAYARALDILLRQGKQMARLIDDLLDISRITRGRIELERAHIDVVRVIEEAVEATRAPMEQRQHAVRIQVAEQPLVVYADRARLCQIFANLLDNAAKYTPDRGDIDIDIARVGGVARVAITDNGVGIPPELLSEMFEMFRQGDRTSDLSRGGLGLGLAVVRRLVEMHGGRVQAHSEGPDQGSTFVVELPLAGEEALPMQEDEAPAARAAPACAPTRILVVDDSRDAADAVSALLERHGQVRTVYTSDDALALVTELCPCICFLDIGLPGKNGYELARQIRALPGIGADIVLVALTGYGQDQDVQRARAAGFDHHLTKPASEAQLLRVLHEATK